MKIQVQSFDRVGPQAGAIGTFIVRVALVPESVTDRYTGGEVFVPLRDYALSRSFRVGRLLDVIEAGNGMDSAGNMFRGVLRRPLTNTGMGGFHFTACLPTFDANTSAAGSMRLGIDKLGVAFIVSFEEFEAIKAPAPKKTNNAATTAAR